MARKSRNGKYVEYSKMILDYLDLRANDNQDNNSQIQCMLGIPKSSYHDILPKLKHLGLITDGDPVTGDHFTRLRTPRNIKLTELGKLSLKQNRIRPS